MKSFAGAYAPGPRPNLYIYDKKELDPVVYKRGSLGNAPECRLFHGRQMQQQNPKRLFVRAFRDAKRERQFAPT